MKQSKDIYGVAYAFWAGRAMRVLNAQLGLSDLVSPWSARLRPGEQLYGDNDALWQELSHPKLGTSSRLRLDDFWLSEWLPLRPGLASTSKGRMYSAEARTHRLTRARLRELEVEAGRSISPEVANSLLAPNVTVHDPRGKTDMFDSGIGCVRLRPTEYQGQPLWFMGASSSMAAHEGMPVALSEKAHAKYIEQIIEYGAIRCTLAGSVRYMPRELDYVFEDPEAAKAYLLVDDIKKVRKERPKDFLASGVVLVDSPIGRGLPSRRWASGLCAAYVSFRPQEEAVAQASEWLADIYVEGLLGGRILTDFDELERRFVDAPFGVRAVTSGTISVDEARDLLRRWDLPGDGVNMTIERIEAVNIVMKELHDNRNVTIGSGATIMAPVIVADHIESSFNKIAGTAQVDETIVGLLEELLKAVASAAPQIPEPLAEQLARDVETLTTEVTSSEPRSRWIKLTLKNLTDTAVTLGPAAAAILDIGVKLSEVL
jgi:hypothetical protein